MNAFGAKHVYLVVGEKKGSEGIPPFVRPIIKPKAKVEFTGVRVKVSEGKKCVRDPEEFAIPVRITRDAPAGISQSTYEDSLVDAVMCMGKTNIRWANLRNMS